MTISDLLPLPYKNFLPCSVLQQTVHQSLPDCSRCIGDQHLENFQADTKCCFFQPKLPNFQVALSLKTTQTFSKWIQQRKVIFPIGALPTAKFIEAFPHTTCAFLADGLCTIWNHREIQCASYFCSFEVSETVKDVLIQYEMAAMQRLLMETGFESREMEALLNIYNNPALVILDQEKVESTFWEHLWCHWSGRELDFFSRVAELLPSLSRGSVEELVSSS